MIDKTYPGESTKAAGMGHNNPPAFGIRTISLDKLVVWSPAREQAEDVTDDVIDDEVMILADAGQRIPVPARLDADGRIEVVATAHMLNVVERFNKLHPDNQLGVEVRVFKQFDDEAAFRLLAQEIEPAQAASSLARGRFYMRAVEQFGSEVAAAIACRVSKAAVSKNLDVARCIAFVGEKIVIHRDIAQRDAIWLMGVVGRKSRGGDAPDQEERRLVLDTIKSVELAPAKTVFAALRKSVKVEKPRRGEALLTHGEREIGRVRRSGKCGAIRIDLTDAGDIELDDVVDLIREQLADLRRATTI